MDARRMNPYGGFGESFGGLGDIFTNLFYNPSDPYRKAQRDYDFYMDKSANELNPFSEAGQKGLGGLEDWLSGMKDPQEFINKIMGGYQESPYAKYLQQQAQRAGINAGSATGMVGSTPWAQQMQENAAGISSKDMQDWLGRVLGLNTQYGAGQQHLADMGYNAARDKANIFGQRAGDEGRLEYQKELARQGRGGGILSGLGRFLFG